MMRKIALLISVATICSTNAATWWFGPMYVKDIWVEPDFSNKYYLQYACEFVNEDGNRVKLKDLSTTDHTGCNNSSFWVVSSYADGSNDAKTYYATLLNAMNNGTKVWVRVGECHPDCDRPLVSGVHIRKD